ncbi:hypothetical protein BC831DRAFT_452175, partial [Entophlyctis helioformis]
MKAAAYTLTAQDSDILLAVVANLANASKATTVAVKPVKEPSTTATLTSGAKPGDSISGPITIATFLLNKAGRADLLGSTDEETAAIADSAATFASQTAAALKADRLAALSQLNDFLVSRVFAVGTTLSLADLVLFGTLYNVAFMYTERLQIPNVVRYYDLIQNVLRELAPATNIRIVEFDLEVPFVPKPPAAVAEKKADKKADGKAPAAEAVPTSADDGKKADKKKGNAAPAPATTPAPASAPAPATTADKKKGDKKAEAKPAAPAAAPSAASASAADAALPDPSKLDIRVGTIVSVSRHPDADTLYVEEVDLGEDKVRTVVSGLVKYMTADQLENRKVLLLCNLKPAKMRGIESQAMVLAATSADGTTVELLDPPAGSANGDVAYFDGYKGVPEKQLNSKKKVWESIQPQLQTDKKRQALYVVPDAAKKQCLLRTDRGVCTVKTVTGASIK